MAPTLTVLIAVGYCCWPYLEDPGQGRIKEEKKKLAEIGAAVLSPKIDPSPGRDPFGMSGKAADLFKTIDKSATRKDPNQPAGAAGSPATPGGKDAGGKDAGENAPRGPSEKELELARKNAEQELKKALTSLTLNGTFLRGSRKVAVINGELYSEGATLDKADPSFRALKVSQVHQHKVVIESQGQTAELRYANIVPQADPAPANAVPAPTARTTIPNTRPVSNIRPARTPAAATP